MHMRVLLELADGLVDRPKLEGHRIPRVAGRRLVRPEFFANGRRLRLQRPRALGAAVLDLGRARVSKAPRGLDRRESETTTSASTDDVAIHSRCIDGRRRHSFESRTVVEEERRRRPASIRSPGP